MFFICGLFLLVALELIEDFTGTDSLFSKWSQDGFYRIVGASPKVGEFFYPTDAQEKITTVVLSDSEDMSFLNASWPVNYAIHADVLRSIAEYHPKAI